MLESRCGGSLRLQGPIRGSLLFPCFLLTSHARPERVYLVFLRELAPYLLEMVMPSPVQRFFSMGYVVTLREIFHPVLPVKYLIYVSLVFKCELFVAFVLEKTVWV